MIQVSVSYIRCGFVSTTHFLIKALWFAGVQHYNEIKGISICEFLPPHLAIYVDQPAEEVQKKLKQSSKVLRRCCMRLTVDGIILYLQLEL